MLQYIEAPSNDKPLYTPLFIAGGISNCPLWQEELVEKLKIKTAEENINLTVFNPRRRNVEEIHFSENPTLEKEQIEWEHKRLREVKMISFWFASQSIEPITLFELGSALERKVGVVIGIDPAYSRRRDVEIQSRLMRPDITIVYSLEHLAEAISTLTSP